ncbi:hypothetical protein [Clostridium butyricum]|uniref:hypothetical protein n=1 Tax=Clostridium butyricum TaxID=1492 RepID=UPI003564BA56
MYSSKIIEAKGHEGMTLLASSIDDDTKSIPDIGFDFFYNEQNCRNTLKISGNSWLGFTGSNEELKVNRRDTKADKIYYAKETIEGKPTFRIRWEGFNSWSYKGNYNIAWEAILYNDSAFVLVVEKTTKDGTDSFENPSKGRTDLDFKAGISYVFIPSEDGGKAYLVQEGSYIQAKIKYLIVDGNDIKRWDDKSKQFIKVSEVPLTREKFINYGDDALHKERAGIVNAKPVLKIWSDAEKMVAPTIVQTLVPNPTIIEMKEDILFNEDYIIAINKAVVEAVNKGNGLIKFIVSTDSGGNFKSWNGSSWISVDKNNLEDVKNNGMSIDTLQGINQSQWNSLGLESKKLRFAFYMEISSSNDELKLNQVTLNYETKE